MSSSADWSDQVETIMLPWVLKLAPTTFMCFALWLLESAMLILSTIRLGSGLFSTGMPCGGNWATSLDGWYEALGLEVVFVAGFGEGVVFRLELVGWLELVAVPFGAWIDPLMDLLLWGGPWLGLSLSIFSEKFSISS